MSRPRGVGRTRTDGAYSETQLRSRLKKWRVTKPSRQTRKKPLDDPTDNGDDDEEEVAPDNLSPVETKMLSLPTPQSQPAQIPPGDVSSNTEWYASTDHWVQQQQQPEQPPPQSQPELITQPVMAPAPTPATDSRDVGMGPTWTTPVTSESLSQQSLHPQDHNPLRHNPSAMQRYSMMQQPSGPPAVSYDMSQPAPPPIATNTLISPSYMHSGYAMSPMSYQPPAPQWPTEADSIEPDMTSTNMNMSGNWYSAHYDPINTPAPAAYYQRASIAGYPQMMSSVNAADMTQAFQSPSMSNAFQTFEDPALVRPWRRAMSAHYGPEAAAGHARVDRQGRQRKPIADRKRKEFPAPEGGDMIAHQQQMQMHSIQPMTSMQSAMQPAMQMQYITPAQHPMMSRDYYAYMAHDHLLPRP